MRGRIALLAALTFPAFSLARDTASPEPPFRVEHRLMSGSASVKVENTRGALVRIDGTSHSGQVSLTFKDGDSPTRFTVRLGKFGPAQSVSVGNGQVSLTAGQARALRFDRFGKAARTEEDVAFTLALEQSKDGDLDVLVRCAPGKSLGKEITFGWTKQQQGPDFRGGALGGAVRLKGG